MLYSTPALLNSALLCCNDRQLQSSNTQAPCTPPANPPKTNHSCTSNSALVTACTHHQHMHRLLLASVINSTQQLSADAGSPVSTWYLGKHNAAWNSTTTTNAGQNPCCSDNTRLLWLACIPVKPPGCMLPDALPHLSQLVVQPVIVCSKALQLHQLPPAVPKTGTLESTIWHKTTL
jgi:hypothetical protein